MTVSPKHAALAAKLVKMGADIDKRIDELYQVLVDIKDVTLPAIDEKISWYRVEDNDKKADAMEQDIRDNLKAIGANVFAVQKIARKIMDDSESLERGAGFLHTSSVNDRGTKMYTAANRRKGEPW